MPFRIARRYDDRPVAQVKDRPSGNGIGLGGLLFVVFVVLKLTGVIAWSWWWVAGPLWIPLSAVIVFAGFALVMHELTRPKRKH